MRPRIGVLALQGDFAAHAAAVAACGAEPVEVRLPDHLAGCQGLVLPGGESSTLLRLLEPHGLLPALREFHRRGAALLGTCAGAILLAREVLPPQPSLGFIDLRVERNAFGRQRHSFESTADPAPAFPDGDRSPLGMLFIRAPRILQAGPGVEVLATRGGEVVVARQGRVWACTGHPELTSDRRLHRAFVATVQVAGAGGGVALDTGRRHPDDNGATSEPAPLEGRPQGGPPGGQAGGADPRAALLIAQGTRRNP